MAEFDVKKSIEAQKQYVESKGYPLFAPHYGFCWRCRKNIYEKHSSNQYGKEWISGITTEQAASELVTGCPHCHVSFCD